MLFPLLLRASLRAAPPAPDTPKILTFTAAAENVSGGGFPAVQASLAWSLSFVNTTDYELHLDVSPDGRSTLGGVPVTLPCDTTKLASWLGFGIIGGTTNSVTKRLTYTLQVRQKSDGTVVATRDVPLAVSIGL